MCFSFILGCKSTQLPNGPYDVPTVTATATNTATPTNSPTPTATLGPVNVSCYVNYGGSSQNGVSWNLVDPNGNTINTTTQTSGGTPLLFTPSFDGIYSVNIPTQTRYLYSSQPLTIAGAGNYSVTFSCSGQTLSTNPTSIGYSSSVGYQIPVTVSYSYSGNLDVPVSIITSGLSSAFSVSSGQVVLNSAGSSGVVTLTKNSCSLGNTSLNLSANDFGGTQTSSASVPINRGYSIPVTFSYSATNLTHSGSTVNATLTIFADDGGISCGSNYSFNTSFQPSFGPAPVPYSGSANNSVSGVINMSSSTIISEVSDYVTATDITFTLPDGSTRTCSGCISFSAPNGIGKTEILSTSY
jgi:hypothetical protein